MSSQKEEVPQAALTALSWTQAARTASSDLAVAGPAQAWEARPAEP